MSWSSSKHRHKFAPEYLSSIIWCWGCFFFFFVLRHFLCPPHTDAQRKSLYTDANWFVLLSVWLVVFIHVWVDTVWARWKCYGAKKSFLENTTVCNERKYDMWQCVRNDSDRKVQSSVCLSEKTWVSVMFCSLPRNSASFGLDLYNPRPSKQHM